MEDTLGGQNLRMSYIKAFEELFSTEKTNPGGKVPSFFEGAKVLLFIKKSKSASAIPAKLIFAEPHKTELRGLCAIIVQLNMPLCC